MSTQAISLPVASRWAQWFAPAEHAKAVRETAQKILNSIQTQGANSEMLSLAERLISQQRSNKGLSACIREFDRNIAPFRQSLSYSMPANQKALEKWKQASQPLEVFRDHPKFVEYLSKSLILSQLKITRDTVRIIDGSPALLVEGEWVKEAALYDRFTLEESKLYNQKFIVHKTTRHVYSYLDNGRGLQKHHPFHDIMTPISTVDAEGYDRTWKKASEFILPPDATVEQEEALKEERPFILQLVSMQVNHGSTNAHEVVSNPDHPYLHLIAGRDMPERNIRKGDVFGFGFMRGSSPGRSNLWRAISNANRFLSAEHGAFRSPDFREYLVPEQRIVTNMPISAEKAESFIQFIERHHRDGMNLGKRPGFHFTAQNCSVFCRKACEAAGIDVPTEITVREGLSLIAPEWIKVIGRHLSTWMNAASTGISRCFRAVTPEKLLNVLHGAALALKALINKIRDLCLAIILNPITLALGGRNGQGGEAFAQRGELPRAVEPPQRNWRNVLNLANYKVNLPYVAQQWQRQQRSTVYYDRPVRLAVAVPQPT